MTKRSTIGGDVAAAGLLAVGGYAVAAFKLAAVSWDGSWYLFRSLQDQTPFIPHCRYGTYPILWLVVMASHIIPDPQTLGAGYGLLLALFPLGSLALSWYFLRGERDSPLRIWPALGILLTPLPGQFCLMSEATPAAQLLWPMLAILVTGPHGWAGRVWLIVLSAFLGFLHPTAALIFALAAGVSGWQARSRPGAGREHWIWAGIFGALSVGELILTSFAVSYYERSQMSMAQVWEQLGTSVLGFPLLLLILVYLLGFIILAEAGVTRRWPVLRSVRGVYALICVAMLWGGLRWSAHPENWRGLLDYRRFVLPAAFPLTAMAFFHYRRLKRESLDLQIRASIPLWWVAAVCCVVLIMQAQAWGSLLEHFNGEIARRARYERFVMADELAFTRPTPLRHWSACPLSILLQGRHPQAVFVLRSDEIDSQGVQVNPWERILLTNGWFALEPIHQQPDH